MCHPTLYMSLFRIRHRPAVQPSPAHGGQLTPYIATSIRRARLHAEGPRPTGPVDGGSGGRPRPPELAVLATRRTRVGQTDPNLPNLLACWGAE